jgi:outer membrane protein TolC
VATKEQLEDTIVELQLDLDKKERQVKSRDRTIKKLRAQDESGGAQERLDRIIQRYPRCAGVE